MIKGESAGFKFTVTDEALDNWELLEILRRYDQGEGQLVVDAMQMVLGSEQYEDLKKHLKKTDGRISSSKMIQIFSDIMSAGKSKN